MNTIPDYGISPTQFASPDIDNAELAARLGIDWFRRSGRVIYWDKCDSLSPWYTQFSGTGGAVAVDNTLSYEGANSFKLTPGSDAFKFAQIIKFLPALSSLDNLDSKIGIDFYFHSIYHAGGLGNLQINVDLVPIGATDASKNIIKLNFTTGTLYYYDGGALQPVSLPYTIPCIDVDGLPGYVWHNIKVVLGWGKYYRIYFDGATIPLPFTALPLVAPGTPGGSKLTLVYNDPGYPTNLWLDNIIVTVDEA